ncbi:helix-turn-helix transcriptional regulator [Comamonas guangdongensis]|uniref:LuxR C-terminal-related transcriptional regulator n=1 Tax=Comamonas guangdongensis TaxID=510515 RepID=A0ABV3ZW63_9BURK
MAASSSPPAFVSPSLGQALIEAAATPHFASVLLGTARQFDCVDEVFAYQVDTDKGDVCTLLASGERRGIAERTGEYAKRFHARDPLLAGSRRDKAFGFSRRVRAADIPQGEYRELCFDQPGFLDKVSFGWQEPGRLMVLSFYRGLHAHGDSAGQLWSLGQVAMAALSLHARSAAQPEPLPTSVERDARQVLQGRLQRSFPQLTVRERQIVTLTLLGDSAAEIASALAIKPATVLTYRQRAYERYRFNRASDFLAGLLH